MPNNPYFVFDGKLCKAEGMTKEQIINAIAQATGVTPSDVDAGFISTILEGNKNKSIHFWYGTQAEYDAMESHDNNTFYIIDGDASFDDLEAEINNIKSTIQNELQPVTNTLRFEGGTSDITLVKKVSGGTVVTENLITDAGLYVLQVRDTSMLIGNTRHCSNVIVYFDETSIVNSAIFNYVYYDGIESHQYKDLQAYIRLSSEGTELVIASNSAVTGVTLTDYEIYCHKIGVN